jgi:hypothetical protein
MGAFTSSVFAVGHGQFDSVHNTHTLTLSSSARTYSYLSVHDVIFQLHGGDDSEVVELSANMLLLLCCSNKERH